MLTKEGSRQLLTSQTRPPFRDLAWESAGLALLSAEGLRVCSFGCCSPWMTGGLVYFSSSSPSSIFYMGLRRWQKWITYVVESFWQWIGVSKHKRLALSFLLSPLFTLSAPSPAPTFPLPFPTTLPSPPLAPLQIYYCNVWIELGLWTRCQTTSETLCWGSRLYCDVFLSASLFQFFFSFLFLWGDFFPRAASSCSHMLPTSAFPILLTGYCVCRLCGWECPQPSDRSNQEWLKNKNGKIVRCEWEKKGRLRLAFSIQIRVRCCKWQKAWSARDTG